MKVLIYDLETRPNVGYIWGKYEQNVIEYVEEWSILCFAYKWLGDKTTKVVAAPDFAGYDPKIADDFEVVEKLWELFDQADVVIAHNGDSFDQKKTHARFVYHHMSPPSDYKQIDTKKVAKRYFNFNSNKLDDLGEYFKVGRKVNTGGFELWKGCMEGDLKAWAKMKKYNKQDVDLLEKVYLRMRPWMKNHPSIAVVEELFDGCPICGGDDMQKRGFSYTKTGRRQRYQCQTCHAWSTDKKTETLKQVKFVN